jgi:hypothetical protein
MLAVNSRGELEYTYTYTYIYIYIIKKLYKILNLVHLSDKLFSLLIRRNNKKLDEIYLAKDSLIREGSKRT